MRLILMLGALALSACASSNLKLAPVDGSKADGVVVLSVETGSLGTPTFDAVEADTQAAKACMTWGYGSAELTSSYEYKCRLSSCAYRVRYQCTQR
jgi:hypothetical protein